MGCATAAVIGSDVGKDCAQVPVLGDRGVRDALLVWIKDGAGQGNAVVPNLNAPVGKLVGVGVFANQTARYVVDFQTYALVIVLQGQILADIALVAQTEVSAAIVLTGTFAFSISSIARRSRKSSSVWAMSVLLAFQQDRGFVATQFRMCLATSFWRIIRFMLSIEAILIY